MISDPNLDLQILGHQNAFPLGSLGTSEEKNQSWKKAMGKVDPNSGKEPNDLNRLRLNNAYNCK